ncbi:MAG TPA: GNAT family N-acetyltransferase [Acidothermaceae bacterium]|nr:GNAT family N-acetyltransferase [Acidothermaceae bacterium]
MAVTLRPMSPEDIGPWLEQSKADHIADRLDTGEDPQTARSITDAVADRLFPGGAPAPGQFVFVVTEDGLPVGSVWIGAGDGPPDVWFLWSIEIDVAARGHGLGRHAMRLAEDFARKGGATKLELNVFGNNSVARGLYESLGYRISTIQMSKVL